MKFFISEQRRKKTIAAVYPIPNPLRCEEEYFRYIHQDLADMTMVELHREFDRVAWCLLFDDKPHPWLAQREERLRALIHAGAK